MGHSTGCQDIMEYLVGKGALLDPSSRLSHLHPSPTILATDKKHLFRRCTDEQSDHESRPRIHGAILQGGVSDREAWDFLLSSPDEKQSCATVLAEAQRLIAAGKEREIVPRENNIVQKELGAAISAYRTNSLLAKGGDDDYFSTDLDDSSLRRSFGQIPSDVRLMFLLGAEDPFVHKSTDKQALLSRWAGFVKQGGASVDEVHGGVVEGGHHNLDGDPEEVVGDLVKRVVGFVDELNRSGEAESRL
jgi:hypothetical protein